jgi:hypothetical protein
MLCVPPGVFSVIVELIKDHNVFHNNSNVPQTPVDHQLAVTLYQMGHFGNAASLADIAREAGCSEGFVELWTDHCLAAIESLHNTFVQPLTPEEKEAEKVWMDENMGFKGLWREGWLMYDGTIIVLYAQPGMEGDAYYTCKSNYGLNLQVKISSMLSCHIYYSISDRLEMYHQHCALQTILLDGLGLLMMQLLLSIQQLPSILNFYSKDKNLHGLILHIHWASLFTRCQPRISATMRSLTRLSHIYECDQNIAWKL